MGEWASSAWDAWISAVSSGDWKSLSVFVFFVLTDGLRLGFAAVCMGRFSKMYRAWNKACVAIEGRSVVSLMFSTASFGTAHPTGMWFFILSGLVGGLYGFTHWVGADAGRVYGEWLVVGFGGLAFKMLVDLFNLVALTVMPCILMEAVADDRSSPIGAAMHESMEELRATKAAIAEADQLAEAIGPASSGSSKSRRL